MKMRTDVVRAAWAALLLAGCTPTPGEVMVGADGGSGATSDATGSSDGPSTLDDSGTDSGSGDDTGPEPVCGNGIREGDEECDLGEANNTGDFCRDNCVANICGDGYVAEGELCDDGNDVNDDDCTNDCGPTSCGDGRVQPPEQCDEGRNNSSTGACLPSCVMASCGDLNIQDGVEACDGVEFGPASCASEGFDDGELACSKDCTQLDTSGCFACGNGVIEAAGGEQCDGEEFGGQTCDDFMPGGVITVTRGVLTCTPDCMVDAGTCVFCGDGVREGDEECDGEDLGGQSCGGLGFDRGSLGCDSNCQFNDTGCSTCGDDVIEGTEQCDGANLGGATCDDMGLAEGEVSCDSCVLDYSNCSECGNDNVEGPEQCDGEDFAGATCMSISAELGGGDLNCTEGCVISLENCCRNPGALCDDGDECCSGVCTDFECT